MIPNQLGPLRALGDEWSGRSVAEWIAGQYRDILGVEIALQPLERKTLVAAMSEPATYPQNWLSVYWACTASFAQDIGYCHPDFDGLVSQADRELDRDERLVPYEEAGQLLIADVPGVFVSHGIFSCLVKPAVTGYAPTPQDAGWPGHTASLMTVSIGS